MCSLLTWPSLEAQAGGSVCWGWGSGWDVMTHSDVFLPAAVHHCEMLQYLV